MRYILIAIALAASVVLAAPGASYAQTAGRGTVQITVDNVRHRDGTVLAELRTEGAWMDGERAAGARVTVPATGPVVVTFADVPPGRYAVRLFQDRNGDDELQTNFIGFPTEPWGLSNNAPVVMSFPEFSEAAFTVSAGQTARQSIRLR